MATNYWDYIRVEDLLKLQGGLDDDESKLDDGEVLFIAVHQVYELWFKLILRNLSSLRDLFKQDPVPEPAMSEAAARVRRITTIMRVAVKHFEVVETLDSRDYLAFRDKLFPASGFQSAQMREMEILLGLKDEERIGLGSAEGYRRALESIDDTPSPAAARVAARAADVPTLKDAVTEWLYRTPIRGSQPQDEDDETIVDAFLRDYLEQYGHAQRRMLATIRSGIGDATDAFEARIKKEIEGVETFCRGHDRRERRVRAAILFILAYPDLPLLAWPRQVLDEILALEQSIVIFRQRHARMVERVIGRRTGTGGSSGVDYLDDTAREYRVFRDLWTARTILIRGNDLPDLADRRAYDFTRR